MNRTPPRSVVLGLGTCLLSVGCGRAPAIDVIGSFFPVWMACFIISIILAALLRLLLLRYKLEPAIEPVALFYPAVVLLLSCLLWLIFFR